MPSDCVELYERLLGNGYWPQQSREDLLVLDFAYYSIDKYLGKRKSAHKRRRTSGLRLLGRETVESSRQSYGSTLDSLAP